MQGIALERPAEGPSDAIPVTLEAIDAVGAIGVGCVAGTSQRLPFEDTEPDFDLIQPRGMQRQELEVTQVGSAACPSSPARSRRTRSRTARRPALPRPRRPPGG